VTDVVVVQEPSILVTVVEQPVTVGAGQPGLVGPPGPMPTDALRVSQRLSEFDTPEAKAAARINLELQWIDCGEF
jgi:hypothetical protein